MHTYITRTAILIILCLSLVGQPALSQNTAVAMPENKPTVALVLGGGAARGFSHIGLIQAFEENGIPIDILIGTSMGSIVASLYAAGYSVENMTEIVTGLDTGSLIDFQIPPKGGLINTTRLRHFLDVLLEHKTFDQLDTSFYSVITQLDTGTELALNQGPVSLGVQASMAIPALFAPIYIDGAYYVDGGMKNAVPVNVASDLGADIIIAVDVKKELATIDYDSILNNLQLAMWFMIEGYVDINTQDADVIIVPDVQYDSYMEYQRASFFIEQGYLAGQKYMGDIKAAILAKYPQYKFSTYKQSGYPQDYMQLMISQAEKFALNIVPPLTLAPEIQMAVDHSHKLGLKIQHGPLSWFYLGYRYNFSDIEGGHEPFIGWIKPGIIQAELHTRYHKLNDQPGFGLMINLPIADKTDIQANYQLNSINQWHLSIKTQLYNNGRWLLNGSASLFKKTDTDTLFTSFDGRVKLALTNDYVPFIEAALIKPYLYGSMAVETPTAEFNWEKSLQGGLGCNLMLFGLNPVDISFGIAKSDNENISWKLSVSKEVF